MIYNLNYFLKTDEVEIAEATPESLDSFRRARARVVPTFESAEEIQKVVDRVDFFSVAIAESC